MMYWSSPHIRLTSSFNWRANHSPIIHPFFNSTLNTRKFDGKDCRFNETEEPFDVTIFRQYALMQHLERKDIDNVKKIETTTHGVVVTGIVTATSFSGGGNDIVTSRWTIGANGSSDYTFTGPGGLSGANDPTIYLARGQTYEFVNNSGGSHPFQIRVSNGGSAYSTGVTNNGASSGTIKFEVPFAAPNTLVYQCTAHSGMVGNIVVYPSV